MRTLEPVKFDVSAINGSQMPDVETICHSSIEIQSPRQPPLAIWPRLPSNHSRAFS